MGVIFQIKKSWGKQPSSNKPKIFQNGINNFDIYKASYSFLTLANEKVMVLLPLLDKLSFVTQVPNLEEQPAIMTFIAPA